MQARGHDVPVLRGGPVKWRDADRIGDPSINYSYRVQTVGTPQGDTTS